MVKVWVLEKQVMINGLKVAGVFELQHIMRAEELTLGLLEKYQNVYGVLNAPKKINDNIIIENDKVTLRIRPVEMIV